MCLHKLLMCPILPVFTLQVTISMSSCVYVWLLDPKPTLSNLSMQRVPVDRLAAANQGVGA